MMLSPSILVDPCTLIVTEVRPEPRESRSVAKGSLCVLMATWLALIVAL